MQDWIALGKCMKPHGIKGGFSFQMESGGDCILEKGMSVLLRPLDKRSALSHDGQVFEVANITKGHKVMAYLKGIENRNQAEEIIPFSISVHQAAFPLLDDDEFYWKDLKGLFVKDANTGEMIGKVTTVYDNGVQVVIGISGKIELDIPLIESFVPEINWEEGYLLLNPIKVV